MPSALVVLGCRTALGFPSPASRIPVAGKVGTLLQAAAAATIYVAALALTGEFGAAERAAVAGRARRVKR